MEWKNIYRGLMMGASDVVPGVSGGTIAVLLGIYDRLIEAINGILTKRWRKHIKFLLPLVIGVGLSIFSLSHLMKWLFKHHAGLTYFFFLGLIIGILPYLFRESNARQAFKLQHIVLLIIGILLLIIMPTPANVDEGEIIQIFTTKTYLYLFVSACLASAAMILPGISGSLVFLILGVYPTVMTAVSDLDFLLIGIIGTGILFGIIVMSKLIQFFFSRYRIATFAIIIGLVIGSIFVIFPGWPTEIKGTILSIITFGSGLFSAYILGKIEYE